MSNLLIFGLGVITGFVINLFIFSILDMFIRDYIDKK